MITFGAVGINQIRELLKKNGEVRVRDNELDEEFTIDSYLELQSYPPQYDFSNAPRMYYSRPTLDYETYCQKIKQNKEHEADFIINELDLIG